jgi:hypothetical protein
MRMREFIRDNRDALETAITQACPNIGKLTVDEIEQWIANDEGLYNWARREGVKV